MTRRPGLAHLHGEERWRWPLRRPVKSIRSHDVTFVYSLDFGNRRMYPSTVFVMIVSTLYTFEWSVRRKLSLGERQEASLSVASMIEFDLNKRQVQLHVAHAGDSCLSEEPCRVRRAKVSGIAAGPCAGNSGVYFAKEELSLDIAQSFRWAALGDDDRFRCLQAPAIHPQARHEVKGHARLQQGLICRAD